MPGHAAKLERAGGAALVERARRAAGRGAWPEAYRLLHEHDLDALSAADLETLADAAWWLSHVEESVAVRRRAHAAYVAVGEARRAGYNAWMLAVEYGYIGKPALAAGWLTKARRHLADEPECVEQGFLAFTEAEAAEAAGDLDAAVEHARRMRALGTRCASADVVALSRQLEGRLRVAQGRTADGLALLDEAMGDVLAGGLSDIVTGWLYCIAVEVCFELSDLERAAAWDEAAMAWCETLPAGTPFHGLCRVHHVELLSLGGAWPEADAEAERACDELMAYHPHTAAESFYVAGELRRRMGEQQAAERAFRRAHELGRDPQPGLALLRLSQGRADEAAAALRSCLADDDWSARNRARLLAASVEVALARGDLTGAREAAEALARAAEGSEAALLHALAATAQGAVALAAEELPAAVTGLRRARSRWLELGLPYEAAQTRTLLARACRAVGDDESAELELEAARAVFARLGSSADTRRVDELRQAAGPPTGALTPRQLEVLRLVADGRTNREIAAALVLSEHTVSRHLDNIYARLGVSSRAAAASFAHTQGLV